MQPVPHSVEGRGHQMVAHQPPALAAEFAPAPDHRSLSACESHYATITAAISKPEDILRDSFLASYKRECAVRRDDAMRVLIVGGHLEFWGLLGATHLHRGEASFQCSTGGNAAANRAAFLSANHSGRLPQRLGRVNRLPQVAGISCSTGIAIPVCSGRSPSFPLEIKWGRYRLSGSVDQ